MKRFNLWVLISLILAIIAGLVIPDLVKNIAFIGTIYINLLKFIIIPIIFTSISVAIYNTKSSKAKIFVKTILVFVAMFVTTFLLTSLIVWLLKPASGINTSLLDFGQNITETTKFSYADIIVGLFPSNLATMIATNSIFAFIIFAAFFGLAASKVKNSEVVMDFVEGLKNIFNKLLEYIMYLTPIAVFALVSNTVASYGMMIVGIGAKYIAIAYLASILTLLLIMVLPVWLYAKVSPLEYIKKISKVWLITASTCSSAATLPYTIKVCNKDFGIPEKITNIVVPLGCTIHMCGGAVSFALLALFNSALFGVEISFATYILMIIGATLINMAAPGIPNGGIVIGATYLSMLNIPLMFIGIYSGMYRILDMAYTTLNVTGDISANIIIAKSEGIDV